MRRYSLELTGETLPGTSREHAIAALAELLRLTLAQAERPLSGRPRALTGVLDEARARDLVDRFAAAGIACRLREVTAAAPPSAAEIFQRPVRMALDAPPSMQCPKCGATQPPGDLCQACGIVFDKYARAQRFAQDPDLPRPRRARAAVATDFPDRLVNQLLLLVFLSSVALLLWSGWQRRQLPEPEVYALERLVEPRQTPTSTEPFQIEAEGIQYRIEPLFDYALDGVVVSLHDADVFWDIYHTKDWKDFINIRDLCVVWGENVTSGVFRAIHYKNTTWTCWVSTNDPVAAQHFAWEQLSNNHLLSHTADIQQAIKSAAVGDQVYLRGKLARYSHAGGFARGTSVTRTDQGNGACETIYVDDFQVVRRANRGWHLLNGVTKVTALLSLLGLTLLFFVAPYRGRPH